MLYGIQQPVNSFSTITRNQEYRVTQYTVRPCEGMTRHSLSLITDLKHDNKALEDLYCYCSSQT
jgi:hypothetical protein